MKVEYRFDKSANILIDKKQTNEQLDHLVEELLKGNKIYDDKDNYIIDVKQTEAKQDRYLIEIRVRDKRTVIK